MLITLAGHDIFKGRGLLMPSTPTDYANFIVACLTHDIGYVRGIIKGDEEDDLLMGLAAKFHCRADPLTLPLRHITSSGRSYSCWSVLRRSRNSTVHGSPAQSASRGFHTRLPPRRTKLMKMGHSCEPQILSDNWAILTI